MARLARLVSLLAALSWARPASAECVNDSACPKDRPICVKVDRHGERQTRSESARSRMRSLCVPLAAEDGSCPPEHRRESVEYLRDQLGHTEEVAICLPPARYGAGRLQAPCATDEDCQRASPHCFDGHCTVTCDRGVDPPCPASHECSGGQAFVEGNMVWINRCVPSRPFPPLARTPFCRAIPDSALQLIAKKGNTVAVWRRIEACALPAGDVCAAAALSARILDHETGRTLVGWLENCRAQPPEELRCWTRSAQLAKPECEDWNLMRSLRR